MKKTRSTTTEADVVWGYRQILGREPETETVIARHRARWPTPDAFFRALLTSEEFIATRDANSIGGLFGTLMLAKPMAIDHHVSPETEARMMDRTRAEWTRLGEEDPHWSVLSHDDYRAEALDSAALDRFHQSGKVWADLVDVFADRAERSVNPGVCLELGCGVGRITRYLAERFDTVIGADISPGNLALCRAYLEGEGVANVETVQVSGLEDFEALPPIDYFYSMIVLQHNPPPIQLAILRRIFARLKPGGQVLFQVQALLTDYSFDAEAYLASPPAGMEMHVLPRHVVLAEMQANDIEVVDVVPDPFSGGVGSVAIHGVKRAPPQAATRPKSKPLLRRLLDAARCSD